MDIVCTKLGQGVKPVCYPLQRQDALMKKEVIHLHKISNTSFGKILYEATRTFKIAVFLKT